MLLKMLLKKEAYQRVIKW